MAGHGVKLGALRHRLVIQAERSTGDGGGGQSDPWADPVTVATVWGKVEPLTGAERLRAMQIEDRLSHRIVIRHRPGITPAMRVRFGSRVFNIRAAIDREERGRFLELLCEEGVAT
ncbi:MAG: phage head closure protein [Proteobacteria bacterium]|nr:phage head closure protein [Pseudomonadota bacterium]